MPITKPCITTDRTISVKEFAEFLQVSQSTIRRHVAAGWLPEPIKIGKQWRWLSSALEAWLDEQREMK